MFNRIPHQTLRVFSHSCVAPRRSELGVMAYSRVVLMALPARINQSGEVT